MDPPINAKKILESFDRNIKDKFCYLPRHNKQMSIQTINHIVFIDTGLNSNMFNIIYCDGATDRTSVKNVIDHFRSRQLPYAFWIGFEHDPSWLEEELTALGLFSDETEWAMICNLDEQDSTVLPLNFEIRQVQDPSGIQDIIHVMNDILPTDEHSAIKSFYEQSASVLLSQGCSLTFFIGYANQKPISISSLFCAQGIASVFDVIVLPGMRGQGLGKIMTLKAMLHAKEKGMRNCILTATNDAKYLYQKLGFTDLKTMKVYHE